jgi:hypothetical protein
MAKIPLTIDPTYCANWGFWEGIRELVQNAKDADEYDGFKMEINPLPKTNRLVVSSEGVVIDPARLLLLGSSSKRDGVQRGKFGEGFVLGILALVRAGHPVTIYNGDEVWRPEIAEPDEGHPFEGSKLLVFNTRKLQSMREAFSVEVECVTPEIWAETKKMFLFLTPPKMHDIVKVGSDTVLLDEAYKGQVFSRGIFVNDVPELDAGYDLHDMKLDRDRHLIDEWDLKFKLSELWGRAFKEHPELRDRIYEMAKAERVELQNAHYYADAKLLTSVHEKFEEEHGEGAVAVTSSSESRDLESLGARKTVVVSKTLNDLLKKTSANAETARTRLQSAVRRTYSWGELSLDEAKACSRYVDKVTKNYSVVDFNDMSAVCRVIEGGQIAVSRLHLATPRALMRQLVVAEAKRRGVPNDEVWLDTFEIQDPVTEPEAETALA